MLTDFQNSLTRRLGSKFIASWSLKISANLKRVATLLHEIYVFKNRAKPLLNELAWKT